MVAIPLLDHNHVVNTFLHGAKMPIRFADLQVLYYLGQSGTVATSSLWRQLGSLHIHKSYLTLNDILVKMVGLGYIANHVRITSRGKTRYTYSITLLGRSILADFDAHCQRFMDDYNAGKYDR